MFAQSGGMGDLHIIVGDTSSLVYLLREEVLDGRAVTRQIDAGTEAAAALDACASPGLFGALVIEITNVDQLDTTQRRHLVAAVNDHEVFVLARAEKLTPAARKDLGDGAGTVFHDAGAGKDPSWAIELYRRYGVTLDGDVRRTLIEAAVSPERVVQALKQLRLAKIDRPTRRQLELLLGEISSSGAAWDVIDAAERGDVKTAEQAAARCSALAVIGYEAKRVTQMGVLVEGDVRDAAEAAKLTGQSPFAAKKTLAAARHHDADSLLELAREVLRCDIEAKEGDSSYALSRLISTVANGTRRPAR